MLVKDLIKMLEKFPQEHQIIIQKDADGTEFSPIYEATEQYYTPNNTWSGSVYPCGGKKGNAIVLQPMN